MKRECESCIKRKTPYCPTSMECMATDDMPYYQNRIMLLEENQELKKQLEEKQNPFKGIFAQVNDDTLLRDCGNMNAEINELKNQQKEFIKYLEDEIQKKREKAITLTSFKRNVVPLKHCLQEYKEIIGDVKNENNNV